MDSKVPKVNNDTINSIPVNTNQQLVHNQVTETAPQGNLNSNTQSQTIVPGSQNPYIPYLSKAYSIYMDAYNLFRQFSLNDALIKFEESQKLTLSVYPYIEDDEQLKLKVDQFLKNISSQIDSVTFQIQNRFEYKKSAGFASKEEKKKIDYLVNIQTEEESTVQQKVIPKKAKGQKQDIEQNESKKSNDSKIVTNDLKERVLSEIVDTKPGVKFSDVIGLSAAKQILKEIIIIPNLRPDLFIGLRSPPRGLLLFGPPGTGKTMIAKAVATECQCTFFNISASSLTSKYLGESEKLVRALFDLAFEKQPSVVFIDEIESILSKRTDNENDATKRLKTEFLVQFDGVTSSQSDRVLIIGATNRPQELDSAVLRRLPKRVMIGPFNEEERKVFLQTILSNNESEIQEEEYGYIAKLTNNYSNSDLKELCREAAYEPIREISDLANISQVSKLRPICYSDFLKAVKKVRGTLTDQIMSELDAWNELYGALN